MARFFFALVVTVSMVCWGFESKLLAAEAQDDFGIAADNSKKDAKAAPAKAKDADEEDIDDEEVGDKDESEAKPAEAAKAQPKAEAKPAAVKEDGDDAEEDAEEDAEANEPAAKAEDEAKPAVVEAAKPAVVEAAKPVVVEAAKPAVVEAAKPAVVEAAKPVVVEAAKPAVVEAAKPVVVEAAKPVAVEAAACPAQNVCPMNCSSSVKCCPVRYAVLYLPNRLNDLGRVFSFKAGIGPTTKVDIFFTRYSRLGAGYGKEYFLDKGWSQLGGGYSEGWFAAAGPWAVEKCAVSQTFGSVKPYSIVEPADVEIPYANGVRDPWAFGVGAGWMLVFDLKMHPDRAADFFAGFAGYDLGNNDF